jgi:hypothetical protein
MVKIEILVSIKGVCKVFLSKKKNEIRERSSSSSTWVRAKKQKVKPR